jgi:hypothetical protein
MNKSDELVRRVFGIRRDEFRRAKHTRMQQEGGGDASASCKERLQAIISDLSAALRDLQMENDVSAIADSLEQASDQLDQILYQARGDDGGEDDESTMMASHHMRMLR